VSRALYSLLDAMRARKPALPLRVTGTSFTGAQRLRQGLGDGVAQAFLPFDTPGGPPAGPAAAARHRAEGDRALAQSAGRGARSRHACAVLANARLSARSARGYARLRPLAQPARRQLS